MHASPAATLVAEHGVLEADGWQCRPTTGDANDLPIPVPYFDGVGACHGLPADLDRIIKLERVVSRLIEFYIFQPFPTTNISGRMVDRATYRIY